MKKLLLSVIAVSLSLAAMATQTAFVRVKLSSVAHPSDATCEIKLVENDARSSAYESGYDAKSMATLSNDYSVLFYGFVGTDKCSDIATNDLTGLELGFTTNNVDTEYKLSFNLFSGTPFYLYDRELHASVLINGSTPDYEFSAPMGQVEINNRFVIGVPAAYNVTLNDYGFLSFSATENTIIPTGLRALQAKYVAMDEELLLTDLTDYIPANTGVILYGTANADYALEVVTDPSAVIPTANNNDLKPSTAWAGAASNVYVLKGDALYEYVGSDFPANKAYLKLPGGSGAPRRIGFRFNGTTDVENVKAELKAEKFMENGQMFIKRGDKMYNLQGQEIK